MPCMQDGGSTMTILYLCLTGVNAAIGFLFGDLLWYTRYRRSIADFLWRRLE